MTELLPALSFAAMASAGLVRSSPRATKRSRPREPDSSYGKIRAVLAAAPCRAFRACDVRQRLVRRGLRMTHEAVSQKLHKMARRRQVQRVVVPGEWYSRWQAA